MAVHRTAPVDARGLFAEFPFLPGAEQLLGELAPSIGALIADPAFDPARSAGRARIRAALDDPAGAREVPELADLQPEERFLSFQFARLLLSALPGRAPIRRWAVYEAKSLDRQLGRQETPVVTAVAEGLGYDLRLEERNASLDLADYLHLATPIREAEFRLVRQRVAGGRVRVPRARAIRLLQEAVRIALTQPIDLADATRGAIEEREGPFLGEIVARLPAPPATGPAALGPLRPDRFPPCVRAFRRILEDGENLSHAGRFALAAFLHRAGASFEAIVDSYRGAPDFDESVTRYQVEHITRKDDGAGYEPPDCASLRSHGLCFQNGDPNARETIDRAPDPLCHAPVLRHPMQYYRIRSSGDPSAGGAAPPPDAGREAPDGNAR